MPASARNPPRTAPTTFLTPASGRISVLPNQYTGTLEHSSHPARMLFVIEPSSPVPIYAQIVAQVRGAVAGGELAAGDPLPSVRQLAGELRVNPNTVAQAYRELERDGVTFVQRGQGTFVAEMEPARRAEEREAAGRAAVERMLDEAFRLGLSAAEVRELVERCLATPGGSRRRDDGGAAARAAAGA